ncbi:hypothetical protein ACOMICROBIO_LMKGKHOH_03941 [Vibrio sp. B1FIG11]|uniref:helix-turn-helix domain-containing protein n=1 Tax=Vibrio sp. B1FIG11 TaxID=2751177 RepID=UPI001AF8A3A4|nr:AraC family transcriptional regulator [Vibrio sp. B1FIG11]CAD7826908.1 hypothetical protein ACOMICROBIO_LMKGKHOH_03941 [Vibrio sp. B1FIG11]CAE6962081.1 hypothetical protein ACOMICROBIO_LMKGKHOH_03941 [Vibrio sp. B1FIG11]
MSVIKVVRNADDRLTFTQDTDIDSILYIKDEYPVFTSNNYMNSLSISSYISEEELICFLFLRSGAELIVGNNREKLQFGGFFAFDAREDATIKFLSEDCLVVAFLLPDSALPTFKAKGYGDIKSLPALSVPLAAELLSTHYLMDNDTSGCRIITAISIISSEVTRLKKGLHKKADSHGFYTALEILKNNIENESMSLEFLASKMYCSRSKAQKIFFENNTTFRHELRKLRMRRLCMNIQNNPYESLEAAVSDSGYKSVSSADKVFKKEKGLSLAKYRKIVRSETEKSIFH